MTGGTQAAASGVGPEKQDTGEHRTERKRRERRLMFFGHFTSFVPTFLIAGMAAMLAVPNATIVDFLVYTCATISLEVCFTCLRAKYATVSQLQRKLHKTKIEEMRDRLYDELEEAGLRRSQCWIFVAFVMVSWALVAVCEVGHMGKLNMPINSKLVALALSGFNAAVALYKMWSLTGDSAEGDGEAELGVNQVIASTVPAKG